MVRHAATVGPWRLTVFTAPTPPRVGEVEFDVLVEDGATRGPVDNVTVTITATSPEGWSTSGTARLGLADNALLRALVLTLDEAGPWRVDVRTKSGAAMGETSFDLEVGPPLPPWRAYWPWLILPLPVLALVAAHQVIVLRRARVPGDEGALHVVRDGCDRS